MLSAKMSATLSVAIALLVAFCSYLAIRVSKLESQLHADRGITYDECERGPACPVSMHELIAHPYRYDGKVIRVTGVPVRGFEMNALFAEVPANGGELDPRNAIWLTNTDTSDTGQNGAAETIGGIFHAGPKGHLGQYLGELGPVP